MPLTTTMMMMRESAKFDNGDSLNSDLSLEGLHISDIAGS
jgi:hypothetical protein